MNFKFVTFIAAMLCVAIQASSAGTEAGSASAGGFAGYNITFHSADFSELPNVPNCCPNFGNTNGGGFLLGGFYEIPFSEGIRLSLRGNLNYINAVFKATEPSTVNIGGKPTDALIEHQLNNGIFQFAVEPVFKYYITPAFNAIAGVNLGIGLAGSYDQKEILTKPTAGTFENSLRTRNEKNGSIEKLSFIVPSLVVGASYELPLQKDNSLKLVPELVYSLGFTNLVSGTDWSVSTIRLAVAVEYDLYRPPVVIPEEHRTNRRIDTLIAQSEDIAVSLFKPGKPAAWFDTVKTGTLITITENYTRTDTLIKPLAYSIDPVVTAVPSDGTKDYPDSSLIVEEMAILSFTPVLNYVFFEDSKSEIPERYEKLTVRQADAFDPGQISQSGTLEIYYNVLNIIGKRLRDYPNAKISVTGCNSNTGNEKGNKELSKARADAVANYLVNTWKIDPPRIKTVAVNLPDNASSRELPEGNEENRRVEIYSETPEILMPLISSDTVRAVFPGIIKYKTNVNLAEKISDWKIDAMLNGAVLKEIAGAGAPPGVVEWKINDEKQTIPAIDGDITYFLEVRDRKGLTYRSRMGQIPQERYFLRKHLGSRVIDKKVENFSLILFEFDTRKTNEVNRRILDFIKGRLDQNSRVLIEGYTDNLGEEDYNLKLSEQRARAVSKYIDIKNSEIKAYGSTAPLYDNKLPEGRFYNRTVVIIVETPIEKVE